MKIGELTLNKTLKDFNDSEYFKNLQLLKVLDFKNNQNAKYFPLGILSENELAGEEFLFNDKKKYTFTAKVTSLTAEVYAVRVEIIQKLNFDLFFQLKDYFKAKNESRLRLFQKSVLTFYQNSLCFENSNPSKNVYIMPTYHSSLKNHKNKNMNLISEIFLLNIESEKKFSNFNNQIGKIETFLDKNKCLPFLNSSKGFFLKSGLFFSMKKSNSQFSKSTKLQIPSFFSIKKI